MSTKPQSETDEEQIEINTPLVACSAINSAEKWIDLEVQVLELWEPKNDSIAQVGLLGDSSSATKFVTWKKSGLPELVEGVSYRLSNVVTSEYNGRFSVELNTTTEIEEITGPDAERDQLASGVESAVAIETISQADQWLDLVVEVEQLWEPNSDSMAQVGLFSDSTGRTKFVAWAKSDLPELVEGVSYRLSNVVTDEYDGNYSVKMTSKTTVEKLD